MASAKNSGSPANASSGSNSKKPVRHGTPTIQDFVLGKRISRGAYAEVYLGIKKSQPKKIYAIKAINKGEMVHKNMTGQVRAERAALAVTNSPFVVKLYYSLQDQLKVFLVMDFMIGGDLKSLLHVADYFPQDMAVFYISEMASALRYLHAHNIIHRDLKPDNVLIDRNGHIKLTDFGLSHISIDSRLKIQDLLGTPDTRMQAKQHLRTPGQLLSLTSNLTMTPAPQKARVPIVQGTAASSEKTLNQTHVSPPLRSVTGISQSSPPLMENKSGMTGIFSSIQLEDSDQSIECARDDLRGSTAHMSSSPVRPEGLTSMSPCYPIKRSSICLTTPPNKRMRHSTQRKTPSPIENVPIPFSLSPSPPNSIWSPIDSPPVSILEASSASLPGPTFGHSPKSGQSSIDEDSFAAAFTVIKSCSNHDNPSGQSSNSSIMSVEFKTPPKPLEQPTTKNSSPSTSDEASKAMPKRTTFASSVHSYSATFNMDVSKPPSVACAGFLTPALNKKVLPRAASLKKGLRASKGRDEPVIQGTPDYLAPEVLLKQSQGAAVDWWALGICLYELLVGIPPFNEESVEQIFASILQGDIEWPIDEDGNAALSNEAIQAITALLQANPDARADFRQLSLLELFKGIGWDNLQTQTAPFQPQPCSSTDLVYFDPRNNMHSISHSDYRSDSPSASSDSTHSGVEPDMESE